MIEEQLICVTWVKLAQWHKLTGDTADAVHSRLKVGKWAKGKHAKLIDGKLWVNVPEALKWIEKSNTKPSHVA